MLVNFLAFLANELRGLPHMHGSDRTLFFFLSEDRGGNDDTSYLSRGKHRGVHVHAAIDFLAVGNTLPRRLDGRTWQYHCARTRKLQNTKRTHEFVKRIETRCLSTYLHDHTSIAHVDDLPSKLIR